MTAADISEADDWLMEQPEPPIFRSASFPSSTRMLTTTSSPQSGLKPSTRWAGRRLELAPIAGRAVVVEDDLAVELFEVGHQPNNLPASTNPSISTSMSSSDENRDSEARAVAVTPSLRMSGLAQWWPGRTHTPNWSSTWARSCACTSR